LPRPTFRGTQRPSSPTPTTASSSFACACYNNCEFVANMVIRQVRVFGIFCRQLERSRHRPTLAEP
jgi:hypothetical protein